MTKEERDELRKLINNSTKVNGWYPYRGGDNYGPEATVRGPFFRWFRVVGPTPSSEHFTADSYDDAKFAAAAMNNLVKLLDEVDRLEDLLNKKKHPPFESFNKPYCRGSYALGSACGHCEKCDWERSQ